VCIKSHSERQSEIWKAMSVLFQLWGSITRVDTFLGAEMAAENEPSTMT